MSKAEPANVTQILALIDKLPLIEAYNFGSRIRDRIDVRQRSWWGSDEQKADAAANELKRRQRQAAQKKLTSKRLEWVNENLKPGMIVKMTGTRDGHGVRFVTDIARGTVSCRQMSPTYRLGRTVEEMQEAYPNKTWVKMSIPDDEGKYSIWEVLNAGTDHGTDKVVGVFEYNEAGMLEYKAIK